ncbi:MAG: polyhydroxyalkanoate synthesis repressor PhaR [Gammaproteobacteria bacterium]|nr:polyhydroxyalkanoate synthesis repressor PhaR [Gammaproteobacteria bacterium]
MRIIKKYPNRRLYDTEISKYITLEDVKNLVLDGTSFIVKDVKTEEDLTRSILLQIISEQEHNGEPLLSTQSLTHLIRFYGNAYQSVFSDYLEQSLDIFTTQQKEFQNKINDTVSSTPLETMQKMTNKNLELWQQIQNDFFKAAGFENKKNVE